MQVLNMQQLQGTVRTASLLSSTYQDFLYTGSVDLQPADLNDPNLSIVIAMFKSIEPGAWHGEPVAVREWKGGSGALPQVQWTGLARRVRLELDLSRMVPVGAEIVQQ